MSESTVRIVFLGNAGSAIRSVRQLETSFSSLSRVAHLAATAIGAAVVGSLALAIKSAIDFDKAMRNVNSIAKLNERQFQSLSKEVLALAKTTGQAPKVLAEGLYDIVSSGFKANAAITVLAASAKAATAGMTDTATASKAVVAVLNAYHLSARRAKDVSDVLFQEVNLGVNTFEELAQNIGDTAPQAAALKIPFQEIAAALATVTLHGTSMAEASTQISRVLTAMVKPTKDLSGEFHQMGFENGQAAVAALGFSGVIRRLSVDAHGNQQTLAQWLGDIRGIRGILNLTGANLQSYTENLRKMGLATQGVGATQRAFAEQSKSISFQWQVAKASLTAAAIPIGQLFFPALIKAAHGVEFLAAQIQQHMPQIRRISTQVVNSVKSAWDTVSPALGRVARFIQTNVAPLYVSAFRSVSSVARTVVEVIRANWPQISATVKAVAQVVVAAMKVVSTILSAVAALARALAPAFRLGMTGALAAVRLVAGGITGILNGINGAIRAVVSALQALAATARAVGGAVSGAFSHGGSGGGALGPSRGAPGGSRPPGRAAGGFVPAPLGAPMLILAHGGEVVLNPMQQQALGGAQTIARMFGFTGEEGPGFAGGGIVSRGWALPGRRKPGKNPPSKKRRGKHTAKSLDPKIQSALKLVDTRSENVDAVSREYDELSAHFSIADRNLNYIQVDADGNESLDTDAIAQRAAEIAQLIAKKEELRAAYEAERDALRAAVELLQKAIAEAQKRIRAEVEEIEAETREIDSIDERVYRERQKKPHKVKHGNKTVWEGGPDQHLIRSLLHRKSELSHRRTSAKQLLTKDRSRLNDYLGNLKDEQHTLRFLAYDITDNVDLPEEQLRAEQTDLQALRPAPSTGGGGGGGGGGFDLGAAAGTDQSDLIQLLLAELGKLRLALGIQNVQLPVIASFQKGTLSVPQTGLYQLHAGETVTPSGRGGGDGGSIGDLAVHVHLDGDLAALAPMIDARVVANHDKISVRIGERADERRRSGRY